MDVIVRIDILFAIISGLNFKEQYNTSYRLTRTHALSHPEKIHMYIQITAENNTQSFKWNIAESVEEMSISLVIFLLSVVGVVPSDISTETCARTAADLFVCVKQQIIPDDSVTVETVIGKMENDLNQCFTNK